MANASVYLPTNDVDLRTFLHVIETDRTQSQPASYYKVAVGKDIIRFNVMPIAQIEPHIDGMMGYIDIQEETDANKAYAKTFALKTKCVLGLVTELEFADNDEIYQTLWKIAEEYRGFLFAFNSLLLPQNLVIGPAAKFFNKES